MEEVPTPTTSIGIYSSSHVTFQNVELKMQSSPPKKRRKCQTQIKYTAIDSDDVHFHSGVFISSREKCSRPGCLQKSKRIKNLKSLNIKDPIGSFWGRGTFLTNLHRQLHAPPQTASEDEVRSTALTHLKIITGDSEIGKTEVVRKFIIQHGRLYSNIIWVDAGSQNKMAASFEQLSKLIQEKSGKLFSKEFLTVQKMYEILCRQKSLFIFDGAHCYRDRGREPEEEARGIVKFLPESLPRDSKIPHILITSTNCDWAPLSNSKTPCQLPLSGFSENESVQFILQKLGLESAENNLKSAGDLVKILNQGTEGQGQGLAPMELDKVVKFIEEKNKTRVYTSKGTYTIQDYIKRLHLLAHIQRVVIS